MTVQLTRGMPWSAGHHWRTKCALSGYQGGKGKGFVAVLVVVPLVVDIARRLVGGALMPCIVGAGLVEMVIVSSLLGE